MAKFEPTSPAEMQVCCLCYNMSTEPLKVTSTKRGGIFDGATDRQYVCLHCVKELQETAYKTKTYNTPEFDPDIPF